MPLHFCTKVYLTEDLLYLKCIPALMPPIYHLSSKYPCVLFRHKKLNYLLKSSSIEVFTCSERRFLLYGRKVFKVSAKRPWRTHNSDSYFNAIGLTSPFTPSLNHNSPDEGSSYIFFWKNFMSLTTSQEGKENLISQPSVRSGFSKM